MRPTDEHEQDYLHGFRETPRKPRPDDYTGKETDE